MPSEMASCPCVAQVESCCGILQERPVSLTVAVNDACDSNRISFV